MAIKIGARSSGLTFFMQLVVGIFFFLLGLYGILPNIDESIFTLTHSSTQLEVIFGVLELLCSVVLLGGLFLATQRKVLAFVSFVIFLFWAARIVLTKFILGISMVRGTFYFAGGFPNWLMVLAVELIIMVSILIIHRRYAE